MMNIKQLPSRLELGFWNLVIHLLSQSAWLRNPLAWFYDSTGTGWNDFIRSFNARRALLWAGAGLVLGFLVGFLAALPLY